LSSAFNHSGHFNPPSSRRLTIGIGGLRNAAVWLLFASSFLVFIEPAPYEIFFALVTILFVITGLKISAFLLPLILLLAFYNIGGGFSLLNTVERAQAVWFVIISLYMAVMGIVIACIFSEDAEKRLQIMKRGYLFAAVLASIAGIMGYFDIAGTFDYFTRYGRAMGTFKDPNVFGTFLVLPIVYTAQAIILGTTRSVFLSTLALMIMIAGVFFSFSRGAWGVAVGALLMCIFLSFITAPDRAMRIRVIIIALCGLALFIIILAIALQFDNIRSTFEVRASLNQSYDAGETGRFGNQARSIPLLLDLPNGFGPYGFRDRFPEDPHNTFVNAFAAYGWLGGISYITLIAMTCLIGWTLVFKKTPWQRDSIAIWSSLFLLILQGMQIDTDHWRHFYILVGLTWGLMLASLRYEAWQKARQAQTMVWPMSTAQTGQQ
jgi:O-Antigen ligase